MTPNTESFAGNGLPVPNTLHQAVSNDDMLVSPCQSICSQQKGTELRRGKRALLGVRHKSLPVIVFDADLAVATVGMVVGGVSAMVSKGDSERVRGDVGRNLKCGMPEVS